MKVFVYGTLRKNEELYEIDQETLDKLDILEGYNPQNKDSLYEIRRRTNRIKYVKYLDKV